MKQSRAEIRKRRRGLFGTERLHCILDPYADSFDFWNIIFATSLFICSHADCTYQYEYYGVCSVHVDSDAFYKGNVTCLDKLQ